MIKPTVPQIHCWCAAHNIEITDRMVARDHHGAIIESIKIDNLFKERREALLEATEEIAKKLCLVSPQRALNL